MLPDPAALFGPAPVVRVAGCGVCRERDVTLTYALRALLDAGVMEHLAFKGGTCLRKLIFGSAGRFSEDLDFTLDSDRPDDDVLTDLVEVFNAEHHGITFTFDEYYKTEDNTSFGGDVYYGHTWNDAGHFRFQLRQDRGGFCSGTIEIG